MMLDQTRRRVGPVLRPVFVCLAVLAISVGAEPVRAETTYYSIKNLGALCQQPTPQCGACESSAFAVNNSGRVVGISHTPSGDPDEGIVAFRTASNQPVAPADVLVGFVSANPEDFHIRYTRAYDINDAGFAVGTFAVHLDLPQSFYDTCSTDYDRALPGHQGTVASAMLWAPNGVASALGTLGDFDDNPTFYSVSAAFAISDGYWFARNGFWTAGRSAIPPGGTFYPNLTYRAFRLPNPPGIMQNLGSLSAGHSQARDVDNKGQIVGSSTLNGRSIAVFRGAGASPLVGLETLFDTAACPLCHSVAYAINAAERVVGEATIERRDHQPGPRHAFQFGPGPADLGTLCAAGVSSQCASAAYDVNDLDQIVGESEIFPGGCCRAFLYQNQTMTDLNTLLTQTAKANWTLLEARGINDLGQIVGTGFFQGKRRGYLLTPSFTITLEHAKKLGDMVLVGQPPVIQQRLASKLDAAAAAFDRGDLEETRQQLSAYEHDVRALVDSRSLTPLQGDKLLAGAALLRRLMVEEGR